MQLLWNYLPTDRADEDRTLARMRASYANFKVNCLLKRRAKSLFCFVFLSLTEFCLDKAELIIDPHAAAEADHVNQ